MKVNGYEVGEMPTPHEFHIHWKVEAFVQRETVAQFIDEYCDGVEQAQKQTQDEFERYQMFVGEEERNDLLDAFNDVMWSRSVY